MADEQEIPLGADAGWTGDWAAGLPWLEGEFGTLREPRVSDAASLFEHLGGDTVSRFISRPPTSSTGFERFIAWTQQERRAGRGFCCAIVPPGADLPAGLIQVRPLEPGFGTAEWGFALGAAFWGTGLFVANARVLVDFVFRYLGVHRLEARAATGNGRGNGALRKLGAIREGVLRQALVKPSAAEDQFLWSILDEDWWSRHRDLRYRCVVRPVEAPDLRVATSSIRSVRPAWRDRLPVLHGAACTLRELCPEDAPALLAMLEEPDVQRYLPPPPSTVEGLEQFIAWTARQREAGRYVCFGVVPDGRTGVAGIIQVRQLEPSFETAEWGFAIDRSHWGRGLFDDAARQVLRFAFETVGVRRLEARAPQANVRANAVLRRLGAVREGHLRRSFLLGSEYLDDALWALLASDWQTRHAVA